MSAYRYCLETSRPISKSIGVLDEEECCDFVLVWHDVVAVFAHRTTSKGYHQHPPPSVAADTRLYVLLTLLLSFCLFHVKRLEWLSSICISFDCDDSNMCTRRWTSSQLLRSAFLNYVFIRGMFHSILHYQ